MSKYEEEDGFLRYSVSLVTQGRHRFYTLTMPSDVLSRTCFVSTRDEDPQDGFQRVLDKKRAQEIADYIDTGLGTIPNSIVLSAQPDAEISIIGRGKTLQFKETPKAFLVLDGQHRVYGFSLAKTSLRVPVVLYRGLSRKDESRLFIDINTKQRPVPAELLLDIKSLADYETDAEELLREVFDSFSSDPSSPLVGLMSPSEKSTGRISRVTFNAAVKPLIPILAGRDSTEIFDAISGYLSAFAEHVPPKKFVPFITNPTAFRAVLQFFPDVASRVKDRFDQEYTVKNFSTVLKPLIESLPTTFWKKAKTKKEVYEALSATLKSTFTL